ncbi:MAG: hypothetical protein FWD71_19375 [Oscillospiraceae bacterium]|nr:hypothetical protein [Oscillospiraceae bacterium]
MYKNKDLEQSKRHIARRNEIISNRLLILFGIAVVVVACFVYFMNMPVSDGNKLHGISFVLVFVLGALLLFSIVFLFQRYGKDVDESDKTVHSKNILGIALFLFFANLLIFFTYYTWIPFLTALAISLTIIIYIYYLYQREFFIFSVSAAIGCFLIYLGDTHSLADYYRMIFKILIAVLAVLVFSAAVMINQSKGFLFKQDIMQKNSKCLPFYILSAILAICVVIEFQTFFDINLFYLIAANLVYFIVVGIYYTVKTIQK